MEKFKIIIAHLQSKLVFQEMIIFLALNYIIQMAIPTMILSTYAISVQDVRTSTSVIDYDIAYQDSGLADLDMTSIVSDSNQIGGEPETKLKLEAPEILEKTKENTITKVFKPKVQTSVSSTVKFDVRPEPSSENYRPVLKAKAYIERLEPLPTLKVLSLLSSNTSDFGSEENSSSSDDFLSDYSKVSMDEENVVYFEAVDPKGFIGNGENADSPVDNVFLVHLPENFEENSDYELQYELKGVTKEGVVMTVNSQRTTGGALVEIQESWSQVKHPINLVDLKEGRNYISFTTNKSLDYSYSVKGLRLVPVRNENRVKFDQESISYADSDGLTYLSGFVNDKLQRIQIGQTTLSLTDPDFELLYQLSPTDLSNGFITVNGWSC